MFNHAPRITRPYQDISGALHEWANDSTHFIVAQHDADEKVKQTHVHIGHWGCSVKDEALKRRFKTKTGLQLSGNEDWKWKYKRFPDGLPDWECDFVQPANAKDNEIFKYLKYLIKGDLARVKYVKNISTALLEAARDAWVDSVKNDNSPAEIHIHHVKVRPPPYQQTVISEAAIQWYAYKRDNEDVNKTKVVDFVCDAMRKCSKGINPHMVRDLSYAVLYDDLEYRDYVLDKCKYLL